MDDRGPRFAIWLNPGVVPRPTPAVALGCITALGRRLVYVNGRICFGSATPKCMGDHRTFYSVFSTVFLMCLSCCLLLV